MTARLVSFRDFAPGVRHFTFEAEGVERLEFLPGQFVSFAGIVREIEITRAYSIASAPRDSNDFDLCLNLVDDGHLTPARGSAVNFRNTIVIATANVGAQALHRRPVGFTGGTPGEEAGRLQVEPNLTVPSGSLASIDPSV